MFSQVFGGGGSPPLEGLTPYYCDDLGLVICYGIKPARDLQKFTSLSTSEVDYNLHGRVLTNVDVDLFNNAYSDRGSYPGRRTCENRGGCTFIGPKESSSQSQATPTEGGGMRVEYYMYRQYINPLFGVKAMHVLHELSRVIGSHVPTLFKPLCILGSEDRTQFIHFCRLCILTINFYNYLHCDSRDKLSKEDEIIVMEHVYNLLSSPNVTKGEKERLMLFLEHVSDFGLSVPTTCGYQFPRTSEGRDNPDEPVVSCLVFLMLGLGVSMRVCNF